jgi:signal transduction histidine kinase
MDKLRLKTPYSFRGRMLAVLLICSILASIVSLLLAFFVAHFNLLEELRLRERAAAIYMLELEQKTDFPLDELIALTGQDDLTFTLLTDPEIGQLPNDVLHELYRSGIAYATLSQRVPITYVQMQTGIISISAGTDGSSYGIAFARVIFASTSFLAVFAMMVTLASFWISKPIHAITNATRKVKEGDFTVKLEDYRLPGEVGELMRSFNAMTDALNKTSYLQKDFISSISHEFKTPIASIHGFARLLQMPGLTDEQRKEYIGMIAQESDRLSRLSQTLLRLSALEQQSSPASVTTFSLDEQLRQVILRLEPTWTPRNISWQLDFDSVTLSTDEDLLSTVWVNIVQNAIKFSPEGSTIEVRVFATDTATVEITDHGIGMDEQTVKRIFDRFYQADRSRTSDGVGLGLCLVKRILDMLGGTVSVDSRLGEGSTFRVHVPFHPPEKHKTTSEREAAAHEQRSSNAAGQ